tara:strand:+ start:54 stop:284 length:231 start_codon:yes stop_codon:yes gene_type:complete
MKVYIVEEDANSHYGMTRISKIFLNKKDAKKYKKKIDNKEVKRLKESQKVYPERFEEIQKRIDEVNEVWITEYNAT